jgi:flagellum-specific ATP synthase
MTHEALFQNMTLPNRQRHHDVAFGSVVKTVGLMIESQGPNAKLGDICEIEEDGSRLHPILTEVVGFKDGHLLLMPLGSMQALHPGARVWNTGEPFKVGVGPHLLGHVLDGLGQPMNILLLPCPLTLCTVKKSTIFCPRALKRGTAP